jgi:hypothetical protein
VVQGIESMPSKHESLSSYQWKTKKEGKKRREKRRKEGRKERRKEGKDEAEGP